mmetsp:Transcript_29738/g.69151  ORF Transcript_29738/g.69151 Transcript_29738/m.69151 type:complete len:373 (-) Transcript_29738:189-1307(-)
MQLWLAQQWLENEASGLEGVLQGQVLAIIIAVVIFGSIVVILRKRGYLVSAMACLYVASLVAIALSMRQLTRAPLSYKFPAFVTVLHYICTWTAVCIYWYLMGEPTKCWPTSVGSWSRYFSKMIPISLALPISIALNNKALVYIGAGLAAIVGTLSPVLTALLSRLFGRRLTWTSWFGVLVAFAGACYAGCTELQMILKQETRENAQSKMKGLFFALGALGTRSVRVVLQDSMMSPLAYFRGSSTREEAPEVPLTGLHLLAAQSPLVIAVSLVFAFITENLKAACTSVTLPIVRMLMVTCVIATTLNFLAICVLKEIGPTSMQIIGKLNSVVTTAVSLAFFGESLPVGVLVGSAIVLTGVAIFEMGAVEPAY